MKVEGAEALLGELWNTGFVKTVSNIRKRDAGRGMVKESLQRRRAGLIKTGKEAAKLRYTGYLALMRQKADGWECVQIVDQRDLPEEIEEEWTVAIPIPEPESMPEFPGW